MFRGDRPGGELNGFLDGGSRIHGELVFDETFRIDGRVEGAVRSKGELVVGESGDVDGEIEAGTVFISGTVRGKVKASKRIEISPAGRVQAELQAPVLVIEEGAFFEGRCSMGRESTAQGTSSSADSHQAVVPLKHRS